MDECLDLTSDTEVDMGVSVRPLPKPAGEVFKLRQSARRAGLTILEKCSGRLAAVRLRRGCKVASDPYIGRFVSSFRGWTTCAGGPDRNSTTWLTCFVAGLKRQRSKPDHETKNNKDILAASSSISAPLQTSKPKEPPAGQHAPKNQSAPTAYAAACSEDDEDADLHIPLAFATKPKQSPAHSHKADAADHSNVLDTTAAIDSYLATLAAASRPRVPLYQSNVTAEESDDDNDHDVMQDSESQPTSAAR